MKIKTGFCKVCDKQVKVQGKSTSHLLHLVLTLITGGLWLIVWVLIGMGSGDWRCECCGTERVKNIR